MGGRLDDELREELAAARVEEVLRKPFDERSLVQVLDQVVSGDSLVS
jgi:CheY-like chemotaxis protein